MFFCLFEIEKELFVLYYFRLYRAVIHLDFSKTVFYPAKMRNVVYTWFKENASISSTGRKVHATRNDLEREKCNTEKHSRRVPEDWKISWRVRGGNFFSSPIFLVTCSGLVLFNCIDCRRTILHCVYQTRNHRRIRRTTICFTFVLVSY